MKIIDLSQEICENLQPFPGDPCVTITNHQNYENGYLVNEFCIGTHTGTHIDAPVHRLKRTKAVDELSIDKFVGKAYVMDFTFLEPLEEISYEQLKKFNDEVVDVNTVIIKTGWADHLDSDDYFSDFPGLSEECIKWFVENGITLVALETPSVNAQKHEQIHTLLLGRKILIVESLINVDKITTDYVDFFAVPLKLKGLDGSPVRAFAIEK